MKIRFFLIGLLLLASSQAALAAVQASVDRKHINFNESFNLVINLSGDSSGEPDLQELKKNFEVLSTSQSSSYQWINGDASHNKQWKISLMAKQPGQQSIPAIPVGSEQTRAIPIQVSDAPPAGKKDSSGKAQNLMLETSLSARQTYVDSPIVLSVRIVSRVNINSASLSEPDVAGGSALVEQLGDDKRYETVRDGLAYTVIERRYAITPKAAGNMSIAPLLFQARVVSSSGRFDLFSRNTALRRLRSQAQQIKVLPPPDMPAGRYWLPAKQLSLVENWSLDNGTIKTGQPITRIIMLSAEGISAKQLPDIPNGKVDGLNVYPDKAELNTQTSDQGFISSKQQKIVYIPSKTGSLTLPAIEIPWWDTENKKWQSARLPKHTIQVAAGSGSVAANTATTAAAVIPASADTSIQQPAAAPQQTAEKASASQTQKQRPLTDNPFFWSTLLLAVAFLLTLIILLRRKPQAVEQPHKPANGHSVNRAARKKALLNIKQAYESNDMDAAAKALLCWGEAVWPQQPPTSLGNLAQRVDQESADWIKKLEQARYSPDSTNWRGVPYWQNMQTREEMQLQHGYQDKVIQPLRPS
ncbi:MAG: BatD family protein [gamma proteobacterium symbiont of Bathyaustriella thionipta]|nr:BatD family protein [gamma proteobacterium symbiont of Bathyaustriella thionipta]